MVLQSFKFFEDVSTLETSNELAVGSADTLCLEIFTSLNGAFEIDVQGKLDNKGDNWTSLVGISSGDFSVSNSLKSNGIYNYGISGLSTVRLQIKSITNNTVKAFGKLIG